MGVMCDKCICLVFSFFVFSFSLRIYLPIHLYYIHVRTYVRGFLPFEFSVLFFFLFPICFHSVLYLFCFLFLFCFFLFSLFLSLFSSGTFGSFNLVSGGMEGKGREGKGREYRVFFFLKKLFNFFFFSFLVCLFVEDSGRALQ